MLATTAQQVAVCGLQVMQTLKDLASEGKTVVCSIHQPRSSIFEMFDDLLLVRFSTCMYMSLQRCKCTIKP